MRSLFKFIFRYTHPRDIRHTENLWPYFSIKRNSRSELTNIKYKRKNLETKKIKTLHNTKTGCVTIFATGPSANEIRQDFLIQKNIIGLNGAFNSKLQIKFDYYCIIDRSFAIKNASEIARLLNQGTILFTTIYCLSDIIKTKNKMEIENIVIIEDINDKPFEKRKTSKDNLSKAKENNEVETSENGTSGFSHNLEIGFFDGGTVAYSALQIAKYIGFNEIEFIGLDLSNNTEKNRFYIESNPEPSKLELDYKEKILPSFKLASTILKEAGIQTTNYSVNSRLPGDVIEKRTPNQNQ